MNKEIEKVFSQAIEYLKQNSHEIISRKVKQNGIHILAKDLNTGKNETYLLDTTYLSKFVYVGKKDCMWKWQQLYRVDMHRESRIKEMQEAIKSKSPES